MEKMPYQPELDIVAAVTPVTQDAAVVSSDWRQGLPTLSANQVVLRELRFSDAPALFAAPMLHHRLQLLAVKAYLARAGRQQSAHGSSDGGLATS